MAQTNPDREAIVYKNKEAVGAARDLVAVKHVGGDPGRPALFSDNECRRVALVANNLSNVVKKRAGDTEIW